MPTVSTHQQDFVGSKQSSSGTQDRSCTRCRREDDQVERGDGAALHQLECCSFAQLRLHLSGLVEQEEDQSHRSRKPEVSVGHWNDMYAPADDKSRLKWPRRETVAMIEVSKETREGIYLTIEEVAPHGEEPVEIFINEQMFYHAGDLLIPAWPDAGVDMRQGPSGPRPRPDNGGDANKKITVKMTPWKGRATE